MADRDKQRTVGAFQASRPQEAHILCALGESEEISILYLPRGVWENFPEAALTVDSRKNTLWNTDCAERTRYSHRKQKADALGAETVRALREMLVAGCSCTFRREAGVWPGSRW